VTFVALIALIAGLTTRRKQLVTGSIIGLTSGLVVVFAVAVLAYFV
jgi:hypothetical protein